ncbi:uncharacterized protein LOC116287863 [Actinia tenebrosa]|uniref:Uncharacterized protein LOC116287863 n=1 Tax=Actinia tenebrosa TaxID=6105 RepID=A0A6P8H4T4_ACTTE|nr:uncharacterized protein LOC116287863 [Actinia tenebrosa]
MQITVFPVFLIFALIHYVVGNARLTQTPPGRSYAVVGDTVKFNWNYTVVNKEVDFGPYVSSPVWYYYNPDGRTKSVIAVDDGLRGWKWTISRRTCPPRLLYPTVRVSKESVATLVISNVTKNDSGWYGISLVLRISLQSPTKWNLLLLVSIDHFFSPVVYY